MPSATNNSGIRDNHRRGLVADFLKTKIKGGSRLSVVSAYFTIPDVPPAQQQPVVALVDQILTAKRNGGNANIADLEQQLDREVNLLYGLKPHEIKIAEDASA